MTREMTRAITSGSQLKAGDRIEITVTGRVVTPETGVAKLYCTEIAGDDGATHFVYFNSQNNTGKRLFDPKLGDVFQVGAGGIWFSYEDRNGEKKMISKTGIIKTPEEFYIDYHIRGFTKIEAK